MVRQLDVNSEVLTSLQASFKLAFFLGKVKGKGRNFF